MRDTLKKLRDALVPLYGKGETEAMIRIMFHYLKGWDTTAMLIHESEPLSEYMKGEVDKILTRLLNHEPIQYITGEARFHGLDLKVTPDVLIPRPETSELVDIICDETGDRADLRVLDIGTGSGCIAVALARSLRFPEITAVDVSQRAIDVAKDNAAALKVKVNFLHEDIFRWMPTGDFDIIVSNPPYIDESEMKSMDANVVEFEPHSALFVPDADPLVFYRRIAVIATRSLIPGGRLYLEINPRHSEELLRLLTGAGLGNTQVVTDSYGKQRFIIASRQN